MTTNHPKGSAYVPVIGSPRQDHAAAMITKLLGENVSGYTVNELANLAEVSVATIRRALKPMIDDGKVRTYRDPFDGRNTRYQDTSNPAPRPRTRRR